MRVVAKTLVVLLIAQGANDPLSVSFERAVLRVLGGESSVQLIAVATDPPDEESAARAGEADGVVELSWDEPSAEARIHCYMAREQRWVDRKISFGVSSAAPEHETSERGRLLGFAVATMFADEREAPAPEATRTEPKAPASPAPAPAKPVDAPPRDRAVGGRAARQLLRSLEIAGVFSAGLHGNASGIGAAAGMRASWSDPLWFRLFVAGRTGDIPEAQASTRTALLGGGLALSALPRTQPLELELRLDAFANYIEVSHVSEDDLAPDVQSRWLPGLDMVAQAGFRFAGSAGIFLGGGLEAAAGRTEIFTHGRRVATIPPLRGLGELGFRARF